MAESRYHHGRSANEGLDLAVDCLRDEQEAQSWSDRVVDWLVVVPIVKCPVRGCTSNSRWVGPSTVREVLDKKLGEDKPINL